MRTFRFVTALTLALALVPTVLFAGVRDSVYVGDFNVDGSGDCAETTFTFGEEDGVNVSGCSAVYNGTFSQVDLFFIGFWSLEGSTGSGSSDPQLTLSGLELYFGARIYGSGKAFGADVKIYGVLQADDGGKGRGAVDWSSVDPHRSPERI